MMKTVALISYVPNPRANRRMEQLAEKGPTTLIYWNKGGESCPVQDLCGIEQREFFLKASRTNTLKRMLPMVSYWKQALKWMNELKPDIVYAERFDMLFIIWDYWRRCKKKPKIIFEVPDLPHMMVDDNISYKEKIVSKIIRRIENKIYKNVDVLIVTSEKFYEGYYSRWIAPKKVAFMPNSPDLTPFADYKREKHKKFTVGFIGVVRYPEQLKMLIEASKEADVDVLFAGFTEGCPEIQLMADELPNVTYFGRYDYNKDIAKLYGACDAIYSVYNSEMKNVRIALPNKLYEAVYCSLPIIVAKGTYLAEIVEKYGVGVAVSSNNKSELVNILNELKNNSNYYGTLQNNCVIANDVLNSVETSKKKMLDMI